MSDLLHKDVIAKTLDAQTKNRFYMDAAADKLLR